MSKIELTQELIKSLVNYDPVTGTMTWKNPPRRASVGDPVGWDHNGYRRFCIKEHYLYCHRVAFFYMTGTWPDQVDHINHDRSDNRWINLRSVTPQGNNHNRKIHPDNKSGYSGVWYSKRLSKWIAFIHFNDKKQHLGCFVDWFDAVCARRSAEYRLGFHPNHHS